MGLVVDDPGEEARRRRRSTATGGGRARAAAIVPSVFAATEECPVGSGGGLGTGEEGSVRRPLWSGVWVGSWCS